VCHEPVNPTGKRNQTGESKTHTLKPTCPGKIAQGQGNAYGRGHTPTLLKCGRWLQKKWGGRSGQFTKCFVTRGLRMCSTPSPCTHPHRIAVTSVFCTTQHSNEATQLHPMPPCPATDFLAHGWPANTVTLGKGASWGTGFHQFVPKVECFHTNPPFRPPAEEEARSSLTTRSFKWMEACRGGYRT